MYVSLYNLIYTYSFVLLLCTLLLRDFWPSYTIKSRQEGKIKKQRMFVKCWPAPPPAPLPVSSTCDWLPPTDFWSALWPLSTSTIIPSSALLVKPPPPHSRASPVSPRAATRPFDAVTCRCLRYLCGSSLSERRGVTPIVCHVQRCRLTLFTKTKNTKYLQPLLRRARSLIRSVGRLLVQTPELLRFHIQTLKSEEEGDALLVCWALIRNKKTCCKHRHKLCWAQIFSCVIVLMHETINVIITWFNSEG